MIFSDEPRFAKGLVQHATDSSIVGVTKASTEAHVGPGSYLAQQFEERRNGWQRQSFSHRQPMTEPQNKNIDRADYYISGVLSTHGTMATPASPARAKSPGPGYYEGPPSVFSFPTDAKRRQDLNLSSMSGANIQNPSVRPSTLASTPRFNHSGSVCIKDGVLFASAANDSGTVGPGYYAVQRSDFIKRSYNVRAQTRVLGVQSANNTPLSSPMVKPSTSVRQVTSNPRGSYQGRPSSAGSNGAGTPVRAGSFSVGPASTTASGNTTPLSRSRSTTPTSAASRGRQSFANDGPPPQQYSAQQQAVHVAPGTPNATPQQQKQQPQVQLASRNSVQRPTSAGPANGRQSLSAASPNPKNSQQAAISTPNRAPVVLSGRGKGSFSEHGAAAVSAQKLEQEALHQQLQKREPL